MRGWLTVCLIDSEDKNSILFDKSQLAVFSFQLAVGNQFN